MIQRIVYLTTRTVALALTLIAAPALAQSTIFTYQGRLDETGQGAVNGLYDFQFHLYDAATAGTFLTAAVTNNVPVSNGLFTVFIDFGSGFFNGSPRWMEINVRTNGGAVSPFTLTPRQRVTSTPYAIRALEAANATTAASAASANAANAVPWTGITGLPAGFADNIDHDTLYGAGSGLVLSGTTFSLNTNLTDARYWMLSGNSGTTAGTHFLGTTDNQALELKANNGRILRLEPTVTSPNLVGGFALNAVSPGITGGFIGGGGRAGDLNRVTNHFAAIVGGYENLNGGQGGFIGGGTENEVLGDFSSVIGGFRNRAAGVYAAVVAGVENTAGHSGFVGGGGGNYADLYSFTGGGLRNKAFSDYAVIAGGYENTMFTGNYATISGGRNHTNTADYATIGGGQENYTSGSHATIGGGTNNLVTAENGVIAGGVGNSVQGTNATIGGGYGNSVSGRAYGSVIGGGHVNIIYPDVQGGTIAGGIQNHVRTAASQGTVGGGYQNFILDNAFASTIGGGIFNRGEGAYGTTGGGYFNTNSGDYATIPGGRDNEAAGNHSFAAGRRAKAVHDGTFVWADDGPGAFASTTNRQFAVRAHQGVMIQSTNVALDLRGGGAVRVANAGVNTATPVFTHRANATNISAHITTIDHPICNNQPDAILLVTHNWAKDTAVDRYEVQPVGVYYNAGKWNIFHENFVAMPAGRAYNVMVVVP